VTRRPYGDSGSHVRAIDLRRPSASGKGDVTVQIPIGLATLSGTLKLAGQ
jgi:hypothetical protein